MSRNTKHATEIEVGDIVYVGHSRQRWLTVNEVRVPRRGENAGSVIWVRASPSLPWVWLDATRTYPVKP